MRGSTVYLLLHTCRYMYTSSHAVMSLNLFLERFCGSLLAMVNMPGFFLYSLCNR